jgi:hypothetical protein
LLLLIPGFVYVLLLCVLVIVVVVVVVVVVVDVGDAGVIAVAVACRFADVDHLRAKGNPAASALQCERIRADIVVPQWCSR